MNERLLERVERLKHPIANVRQVAAYDLGNIGPAAAPAIPVLTKLLNDLDPAVRLAAVVAIGRIGPAATTAVPALAELLYDPDGHVRFAAAAALDQIRA